MAGKKDWRNFEIRREMAMKSGYGDQFTPQPQHQPQGYYNEGYVGSPQQFPPGQYVPQQGGNFRGNDVQGYNEHQLGFTKYEATDAKQHYDSDSEDEIRQPNPDEFEGPVKKRKIRDVICLVFFAAFAVSMTIVVGYAWANENVTKLWDIDDLVGENCEIEMDPDLPNYCKGGEVFLGNVNNANMFITHEFLPLPNARKSRRCISKSECVQDPLSLIVNNTCYKNGLAMNMKEFRSKMKNSETPRDFYNEFIDDLENTWKDMIYMSLIGLAIALLMTVLLRFTAGIIVWIVVIGVSILCVVGTITLWVLWSKKDSNADDSKTALMVCAIIASVITLVVLVIVISMRKRIALVIRLFKEAGKAIHAMPLILIQPLYTFVSLAIVLGAWFGTMILIESAGEIVNNAGNFPPCSIKKDKFMLFSRWWNIFAVLWFSQFVIACQHFIIASAISTWFFSRNKSRLGFPILTAFSRLLRYHLGSLAFGAFIIAVVKFLRFLLNSVQKRLGAGNPVAKALVYCCKCYLWCLDKFLNFINRHAYIEIAIYGSGFCKSAKRAFKVLISNALRVAVINSIGDMVLFMAKITIVGLTILIEYFILKERIDNEDIAHPWVPLTIGAIFTYYIAHCFITVYEMAIDTIFICFCEDCEMNDGVGRPYFMSKGLMQFLKDSKKMKKKKD